MSAILPIFEGQKIQIKIPFGKWKGYLIKDVPMEYLTWFYNNVTTSENIKAAIKKYL